MKPSQHRLGNLQRSKKWNSKNNKTEEKTVYWGETIRNYSQTKKTSAKFKTARATEQKEFPFEYMFKKQKWFIIRLTVNSGNF